MEKTPNKYALFIRVLCYILIPVAILSMAQSILYFAMFGTSKKVENVNYFETQQFADLYKNSIYENLTACYTNVNTTEYNGYLSYSVQQHKEITFSNMYGVTQSNLPEGTIYYKNYLENRNFKFLVIDNKTNTAVTNVTQTMKTDTIEKIKQEFGTFSYYWNYQQGQVDTNINFLSLEEIKYAYPFSEIENEYDCTIYTAMQTPLQYNDYYETSYFLYKAAAPSAQTAILNFPISIVILFVCIVLLAIYAGKKRGKQEIVLDILDKIPLEFIVLIVFSIIGILFGMAGNHLTLNIYYLDMISITLIITLGTIAYIVGILTYETLVKRIKTHTFWKNTVLYRCYKIIQKACNTIFTYFNPTAKLIFFILAFSLLTLLFAKWEFWRSFAFNCYVVWSFLLWFCFY